MRASNRSTLFLGVSEGADGVSVVATDAALEYGKEIKSGDAYLHRTCIPVLLVVLLQAEHDHEHACASGHTSSRVVWHHWPRV